MSGTYSFSDILESLLMGRHLSEDEKALAERMISEGQATPGQIGAYELASQPDWNLKQALTDNIQRVKRIINSVPSRFYTQKPATDQWSIQEVIGHLADNEMVNAIRVRCILTEPTPELIGYDSDDWQRFFVLDDVWVAFERWASIRRNLLCLLDTLSDEEWQRKGHLSYRGYESIRVLMGVLAGHDERHIRQLKRIIEYLKSPQG